MPLSREVEGVKRIQMSTSIHRVLARTMIALGWPRSTIMRKTRLQQTSCLWQRVARLRRRASRVAIKRLGTSRRRETSQVAWAKTTIVDSRSTTGQGSPITHLRLWAKLTLANQHWFTQEKPPTKRKKWRWDLCKRGTRVLYLRFKTSTSDERYGRLCGGTDLAKIIPTFLLIKTLN